MTLIVTTITSLGIVQASDSNLTAGGAAAGTGPKLFKIDFCTGVLAFAGTYGIQGVPMDVWMPGAIQAYGRESSPTLGGLAHYLTDRLTAEGTPGKTGIIIHLAGYATDGASSHPEMWHVRNFDGIDPTSGDYVGRTDGFLCDPTDDFWGRDRNKEIAAGYKPDDSFGRTYFNGFAAGRISYNMLHGHLRTFLQAVWSNPDWEFHAPESLDELAQLIELELRTVGTLFSLSKYPPIIGGDVQLELIHPPTDVVPL